MPGNTKIQKEIPFPMKRRILLLCLLVVPLFLAIFPVLNLFSLSFEIFPGKDIGNRIWVYNDSGWEGGHSIIEEFTYNSGKLILKYILKEGAKSPLVFFTIYINPSYKPGDLSQYNSLSLQIQETTSKRILMFIKTFEPGISMPELEKAHTLRHNQYLLQLTPGTHHYSIDLNKFITPDWWLNMMKVNKTDITAESYKKMMSFDMQFNLIGTNYILDKEEYICIENISLHKPMNILNPIILGLLILYYPGIAIFLIIRHGMEKGKLPPQKPVEVATYREKELERIKEFIELNYTNENISTRMIYENLGIPPFRVFKLLKEEYQLSFKQLINKMRIKEAKRLLTQTDLRIIEIAFHLGFNNISYFNNLFKNYEKQTPSTYRKQNSNNKGSY
ncbi:MAG: helix-turn-helix transcriptional regulator [Spirochaetales bacterium]|nr:helix-turn-helix transcriptional regulator [Spirochaetales bacterium]